MARDSVGLTTSYVNKYGDDRSYMYIWLSNNRILQYNIAGFSGQYAIAISVVCQAHVHVDLSAIIGNDTNEVFDLCIQNHHIERDSAHYMVICVYMNMSRYVFVQICTDFSLEILHDSVHHREPPSA